MSDTEAEYKILFVGDEKVGKSSYIKKILTNEFMNKYNPTIGCEVYNYSFEHGKKKINFKLWSLAGNEKYEGIREGYCVGADAAIIMFDFININSYKNIVIWYRDIIRVCGNIPCILIGNKFDESSTYNLKIVTFHKKKQINFYPISIKNNYNVFKPLNNLIEILTNKNDN